MSVPTVNPALIGLQFPPVAVVAEAGQMRLFAKATGQTDPVFFDERAAQGAGYRAIVAPPTFVYTLLSIGRDDPYDHFDRMGITLADTLHGSQSFTYGVPLCAGDTVRFEWSVADIYEKKDGELTFVVFRINATNHRDEMIATIENVTIVVKR